MEINKICNSHKYKFFEEYSQWLLIHVSKYLCNKDLSSTIRTNKNIKKILYNIFLCKKPYTSSEFITMPIDKIQYVRILIWSNIHILNQYKLPNKLTHLKFSNNFNQPIECFINLINLTYIIFGHLFNQPLLLPDNLTHLLLGARFNQPVVGGPL